MAGGRKIRIAYMVDDILACGLKRTHQLGLHLVEVVVDCLLKDATLGLDGVIEGEFSQQPQNVVFGKENGMREMGMVLFETELTGTHFLGLAGVGEAEVTNAVTVLALIHLLINIVRHGRGRGREGNCGYMM